MPEEMRKRLEEAAEKYFESMCYDSTVHTEVVYDFTKDAEHGYKEAIAQCKEWLKNYFFFENSLLSVSGCGLFLKKFEDDMNKLWEG